MNNPSFVILGVCLHHRLTLVTHRSFHPFNTAYQARRCARVAITGKAVHTTELSAIII